MTHNEREIGANELFDFLQSISKYFEREINIYALGGTALTILGIKKSTKDIDINIDSYKEYKYVCNVFEQLGFEQKGIRWITQEALAFDIFHGSNILGTDLLSDCISKSKFIESFGNINLYTLFLDDIIISKLARGDERDFEDIKCILEFNKLNMLNLVERYKKTMEDSVVSNYKQKLIDLIHFKFKEWGWKLDLELINEVKKWEE
jgi:hypothetical protein